MQPAWSETGTFELALYSHTTRTTCEADATKGVYDEEHPVAVRKFVDLIESHICSH